MIHTIKINQKYVYCRTSPGLGVEWWVKMIVRDGRAGEKYRNTIVQQGRAGFNNGSNIRNDRWEILNLHLSGVNSNPLPWLYTQILWHLVVLHDLRFSTFQNFQTFPCVWVFLTKFKSTDANAGVHQNASCSHYLITRFVSVLICPNFDTCSN